jgi:protein-tyrosine phosphatase
MPLPSRILVVCKGNICRSAFAGVVLQQGTINAPPVTSLIIRSAGTEGYHEGKGANTQAIQIASEFGYDLSGHIAKRIVKGDIDWADIILTMEQANSDRLYELFGGTIRNSQINLLMSFTPEGPLNVPDPYKCSSDFFRETFSIIQRGCENFLRHITSL